jgi:isocitrate dehydrogenase (NAD+)
MLLPNLYGSIIGNCVAGLVGGAGIAPGANIGNNYALFEQVLKCCNVLGCKTFRKECS